METEKVRMSEQDIALLRAIARWRRGAKVNFFQWRPGVGFGAFTEWYRYEGGVRRTVNYEPRVSAVLVDLNPSGDGRILKLPDCTVTETVDCLVALGALPARFSSAYRAGWDAVLATRGWQPVDGATSAPEVEPAW